MTPTIQSPLAVRHVLLHSIKIACICLERAEYNAVRRGNEWNPAAAHARAWTQRTCVCTIGCMHDWKTFGRDWLLGLPGEKKTRKLRSPPNITSWRGIASAEEIAQFLSRSVSTGRSSGSTVKQPS